MDKSGMFKDFNFKITVLYSLMDKHPSFEEELKQVDPKDMISFFENVLLTDEDMDKVDSITFLKEYEVQSMEDMDLLYNLKSVCYEE